MFCFFYTGFSFFKRNRFLFFFWKKHKNTILKCFYCMMQNHHFQNYTIITFYTYYGIQI